MTIGQVAQRAGVGVETVRFYERRGLLARPLRPSSGFRQYSPDTVDRIVFIRRAKELGFQLREIKELLLLRVRSGANCGTVKRRAEHKLEEIESKIADLRRMKRTLTQLVAACERRTSTAECPVLGTLAKRA
jgi:Hg(II)-responsive transcriptional regulator